MIKVNNCELVYKIAKCYQIQVLSLLVCHYCYQYLQQQHNAVKKTNFFSKTHHQALKPFAFNP